MTVLRFLGKVTLDGMHYFKSTLYSTCSKGRNYMAVRLLGKAMVSVCVNMWVNRRQICRHVGREGRGKKEE